MPVLRNRPLLYRARRPFDLQQRAGLLLGTQGLLSDNFRDRATVASITNVWVDQDGAWGQGDDAFASDTLLVAGTDYALRIDGPFGSTSGKLVRLGGRPWPGVIQRPGHRLVANLAEGRGNIKVTYVGGYATIPADLVMLANQLVGLVAKRLDGQQIQSERLDEHSYTLASSKEAKDTIVGANDILRRYRGRKWMVA